MRRIETDDRRLGDGFDAAEERCRQRRRGRESSIIGRPHGKARRGDVLRTWPLQRPRRSHDGHLGAACESPFSKLSDASLILHHRWTGAKIPSRRSTPCARSRSRFSSRSAAISFQTSATSLRGSRDTALPFDRVCLHEAEPFAHRNGGTGPYSAVHRALGTRRAKWSRAVRHRRRRDGRDRLVTRAASSSISAAPKRCRDRFRHRSCNVRQLPRSLGGDSAGKL